MCNDQVVAFATTDDNMWYRIYSNPNRSTYRAELCGLDRYYYKAGLSSLTEARKWIVATLKKIESNCSEE